jgi:hypothetical protein
MTVRTVVLLLLALCFPPRVYAQSGVDERAILVEFFKATNGPTWPKKIAARIALSGAERSLVWTGWPGP